jgi:hypothetical protein
VATNKLRALFDKALWIGGGTHTIDDVEAGVAQGLFQFWEADDCCAVTEILTYPRCKKLHIFIAAGNFQSICDKLLPRASAFAKENGCVSMTTIARKGFVRRIPQYGFKPKYVAFELDLERNGNG